MEKDANIENIKSYDLLIKSYNYNWDQKSEEDLNSIICDLSYTNKLNSVMHLFCSNPALFQSGVNAYTIISQINTPKRFLYELHENSNGFIQSIMIPINYFVHHPEELAIKLNQYFSKQKPGKDDLSLEYIGFCLLPSLFSFFSIPDLLSYATRLAINMISFDSLTNLSDYYCASYFISIPRFIDFLWEDYIDSFVSESFKFPPFAFFNRFLISLHKASRFLTSYHDLILQQLFNVSNQRMLNVMIKLVFMPTLEIRMKFNPLAHKSQFENVSIFTSLQNDFDFVLTNLDVSSFSALLLNTMRIRFNTDPYSQYASSFDIDYYPCFFSMFELATVGKIICDSYPDIKQCLQLKLPFLKDMTIGYLNAYNLSQIHTKRSGILRLVSNQTFQNENYKPFPPLLMSIETQEVPTSEYKILYEELEHEHLDIIQLLDDKDILKSQKMRQKFRNVIPIIKSSEFKQYAYAKLNNSCNDYLKSFEKIINIKTYIQCYFKPDLSAAKRVFYTYLNYFIPIYDCISTNALNYRIISLSNHDIIDQTPRAIYDEMLIEFLSKLIDFQVNNGIAEHCDENSLIEAVNRIVPIKNSSLFNETMHALSNIISYSKGMIVSDRIFLYSKLFKMIHDLIVSQSDNQDLYPKLFIFILLSVCNKNEFLIEIFEVYCTFFYFVCNDLEEPDEEMNELKKTWIDFKETLSKTLSYKLK